MVIECCSQERSYSTFYGLVSERFCKLNRVWNEYFERAFETYYDTIHRYETNRLRNIARLFGHLLANDAIFADAEIKALSTGMFPLDNPKNTRFSINYFTSIGLGALTEEMREHLKVSRVFVGVLYPQLICCS